MKPSDYQPRDFLWKQQSDLRWSWKKLALSGKSVADIGCALMSLNYIHNRYRQEHGLSVIYPNTWIDWMNNKARAAKYQNYLSTGGGVYWDALNEYSEQRLVHSYDPAGARYILSEYKWGNITHWTVNINEDLAYNPYPTILVPVITYRANSQWSPATRHMYYKAI